MPRGRAWGKAAVCSIERIAEYIFLLARPLAVSSSLCIILEKLSLTVVCDKALWLSIISFCFISFITLLSYLNLPCFIVESLLHISYMRRETFFYSCICNAWNDFSTSLMLNNFIKWILINWWIIEWLIRLPHPLFRSPILLDQGPTPCELGLVEGEVSWGLGPLLSPLWASVLASKMWAPQPRCLRK